jgi:hypothetical protein
MRITVGLLLAGALVIIAALVLPRPFSMQAAAFGLILIGMAAGTRAVVIVRRLLARATGAEAEHRSLLEEPSEYTCPTCGYDLRGTTAPFCPECETVRPMRVDDAE